MSTNDPIAPDDADRVLADCLDDYHRRRGLAEQARPEDYADRVGDRLDEFRQALATEESLSSALGEVAGATRASGEYPLLREPGGCVIGARSSRSAWA